MTHWRVSNVDILDLPAEGLICSANPSLSLSGGVGGAFLARFGVAMQEFLHGRLRESCLAFMKQGSVVVAPPCGSPYVAIAHAVSIDVFYQTDSRLILQTYLNALRPLADRGCRSVAAACLGCGYGRCSPGEFTWAIERLIASPVPDIDNVTFATTNSELADQIALVLRRARS